MATNQALDLAKRAGLDLVEISPTARPPVCKIIDYGKYKYELSKQKKEKSKNKVIIKTKEIKLHVSTEDNDYNIKMRRAEEHLMNNNNVMIRIEFRGRELAHKNLGYKLIKKIKLDLEHCSNIISEPKPSGKSIIMQLNPLPKTSNIQLKFANKEAEPEPEEQKSEIKTESDNS